MSSQLSKEEYLRKYVSGEKKKKKVKVPKGKGTRIFDDDIAIPAARDTDYSATLLADREDRPQVIDLTGGTDTAPGNGTGSGARRQWKALDECDLAELESQRERLSKRLRLLEQGEDVAAVASDCAAARHDSSDGETAAGGAGNRASPSRRHRRHGNAVKSAAAVDDDSDASPPRRTAAASDSDASPPRLRPSGRRTNADGAAANSDESPRRSWKERSRPQRTLDGKRAGLQDIEVLRAENQAARQRDASQLNKMGETNSGRNAETKVRGRKLEQARERAKEEAKAQERKKVYDVWNKGVKQVDDAKLRLAEQLKEMSKPLARHADDADLETHLKSRTRLDDPMAEYMEKKQQRQNASRKLRPRYNKTDPPVNRYGIWPGYRWDGVDRSNGFERKLFERRNAKIARNEDAYKWSTEDM